MYDGGHIVIIVTIPIFINVNTIDSGAVSVRQISLGNGVYIHVYTLN